jgi:hypothetical protein
MDLRKEKVIVDIQLTLEKDLEKNECICNHCKGSGLVVGNNPFGIYGEEKGNVLFPYNKEAIKGCPSCYNGVQKLCKHCDKVLQRGSSQCGCKGYQLESLMRISNREEENWNKSSKITYDEALDKYKYVYIDNTSDYVPVSDLEDVISDLIFDAKEQDGIELDMSDIRIYGTKETNLSIDVSDVFDRYYEDLHEDAISNIPSKKVEELENFLINWCNEVKSSTLTYIMDDKVCIVLQDDFFESKGA